LNFDRANAVASARFVVPEPIQEDAMSRSIPVSRSILVGVVVAALTFAAAAQACTGIRLIAKDGGVVAARTLEFGMDLHSDVLVVPAGTALTGTLPDGGKGISYTTKYGFLGANAEGMKVILDGINDHGLYVGLFYFPPIGCSAISRISMR
jgi:choloylglycine hydrolase